MQGLRSADPSLRPQVLELLDSAQQLGLTVLRVWAFNDGPAQDHSLQRYPGQHTTKDSSRSLLCLSLGCMNHD